VAGAAAAVELGGEGADCRGEPGSELGGECDRAPLRAASQPALCVAQGAEPDGKRSGGSRWAGNVAVGYAIAVLTQILVFPIFGLQVSLSDNLTIGAAFTAISLTRSYVLRRLFEAFRSREAETMTAGQVARRYRLF
jgi:hypothetical protein